MTEKHNPVVYYLRVLVYMLLALCVRLAAFLPLYCLTVDNALRHLWVLCPVLLIFAVLPLRFSFARALVEGRKNRTFSFCKAFSFADYGEKLGESLLHALHILKWGLPMIALGVVACIWYTQVDAITVIRSVTELGAWASGVWCSFVNLFGADKAPVVNGLMEGVYVVFGVIAMAMIVWLIGVVRNSASRYIWALAASNDRAPMAERRRRLRGRRGTQLATGLVNLLLLVPFVIAAALAAKDAVSGLSGQLMMIVTGMLPKLDLTGAVCPLAAAFVLLYLPLLPVRRMRTAAFACGEKKAAAAAAGAK